LGKNLPEQYLKSGDIVLLGGVEVGNVVSVEITAPGAELPRTELNEKIGIRIAELASGLPGLEAEVSTATQELQQAERRHQSTIAEFGVNSNQVGKTLAEVNQLQRDLQERRDTLERLNDSIARQNSRLQNIEVRMRVSTRYRDWVRADSSISLGSIGLLGDKFIEISLGRSPHPPQTESLEVDTWYFGTATTEVVLITGTQQASFAELITGANDILANFETLSGQIGKIMSGFEAGQGTVGRFFTDDSFYNNLNFTVERASQAADRLAEVLENVRSGSGTITKLIQEDELYVRITSSTEKIERLLARLEQGEGTLGRFMKDPSIYEKSDAFLANLDAITKRIEAGEGTLGKLTTDDRLFRSLQETTQELASILKGIEEGKGTLGRLAQDEELYNNLNQLSSELVKLIYDFRQNPKKFLTIKFELF